MEEKPALHLSTTTARPGEVIAITITGLPATTPPSFQSTVGTCPGFYYLHGAWVGLVGISASLPSGTYPFQVFFSQGDSVGTLSGEVTVLPRSFPSTRLYLSPRQMEQRTKEKQQADAKKVTAIKTEEVLPPLWTEAFLLPVKGPITTSFGHRRIINGQEEERHSGWDIAAPLGTPVRAANHGVVKLAATLNLTGKTVILDHGLGLYTSYAHLDHVVVREGEVVEKGQIIGSVGTTGVSTGPHLHWAVSVGTTFVDPSFVLKNTLFSSGYSPASPS